MKNLIKIFVMTSLVFVWGCSDDQVKEIKEAKKITVKAKVSGVPVVKDYKNIIIEGVPYTAQEFWDKFCFQKAEDEDTCEYVYREARHVARLKALKEITASSEEN